MYLCQGPSYVSTTILDLFRNVDICQNIFYTIYQILKTYYYIWNLIETQTSIVYQKILCQSKIFSIALEII